MQNQPTIQSLLHRLRNEDTLEGEALEAIKYGDWMQLEHNLQLFLRGKGLIDHCGSLTRFGRKFKAAI